MDNANMPARAVIFDWAGVFCSPGEPFSHPKLTELTGLTVDEISKKTQVLQQQYYRGHISSHDFWQGVITQFTLPLTPQELSAAYVASYRIYPEMLTLAERVRQKVKTALLSNLTSEMMDDIIRKHFVDRLFDHVLFSNEIGRMKPEPESFALALERFGTKPRETVFVDDSKKNVEAAQALGMQAFVFLSPAQCVRELTALVGFEV